MLTRSALGFWISASAPARTKGGVLSVTSYIGDMTGGTGLAGVFNGTKVGTNSVAAFRTGGVSSAYAGADFSVSAKRIFQADLWPTTNLGFTDPALSSLNFTLYGKNGSAPANATDGTSLGTLAISETGSGPQTITSTDQETLWDYVWVHHNNSDNSLYFVEIEFYEAV